MNLYRNYLKKYFLSNEWWLFRRFIKPKRMFNYKYGNKKPKTSKVLKLFWSNLQWSPMDLFYMYKNAEVCPNQLNWPDNMKVFHYLKKT
jgi:hypothetical protein